MQSFEKHLMLKLIIFYLHCAFTNKKYHKAALQNSGYIFNSNLKARGDIWEEKSHGESPGLTSQTWIVSMLAN